MKNIIENTGLIIAGVVIGIGLTLHQQKTNLRTEKIESYNAGYRAGAMDRLASLVECDGVTDQNVIRDYYLTAEVLERLGELDKTPFPCQE